MLTFTFPPTGNYAGVDTRALMFSHLQAQYPEVGFNLERHYIKKIQAFSEPYRPGRTYLAIGHREQPDWHQEFVYERYDIAHYVAADVFSLSDLEQIDIGHAGAIAQALVGRTGLNINPVDFLIDPMGVRYTGGETRPNWRLEARPDSPFWYGQRVIWLHSEFERPQ